MSPLPARFTLRDLRFRLKVLLLAGAGVGAPPGEVVVCSTATPSSSTSGKISPAWRASVSSSCSGAARSIFCTEESLAKATRTEPQLGWPPYIGPAGVRPTETITMPTEVSNAKREGWEGCGRTAKTRAAGSRASSRRESERPGIRWDSRAAPLSTKKRSWNDKRSKCELIDNTKKTTMSKLTMSVASENSCSNTSGAAFSLEDPPVEALSVLSTSSFAPVLPLS